MAGHFTAPIVGAETIRTVVLNQSCYNSREIIAESVAAPDVLTAGPADV